MSNDTHASTFIEFVPSSFLQAIEALPRFGFQDDFTDLLGTKTDQQSYLVGLFCAGVLLQSIKFAWGMLIVVFMCCGEQKLGFLTGQPFRQPLRVATETIFVRDDNSDDPRRFRDEGEHHYHPERRRYYYRDAGCNTRPTRIRATFLACGAVFVAFSILGVTKGLAQLQSTVVLFESTISRVAELSGEAADVLENKFLAGGQTAQTKLDELVVQLRNDTFCPSGQLPAAGAAYFDNAMLAIQQAGFMTGFLNSSMNLLLVPLKQVALGSDQVDRMVTSLPVDVTDWKVTLMLIPFGVTTVALMGGVVIAMLEVSVPCYTSLTNNFLLPVFSMLVQFAWVTASGMLISTGINGDLCLPRDHDNYDGGNPPDASVRSILTTLGMANSTVYPIVDYYVSQCETDDPLFFLDVFHAQLQESEFGLHRLARDFPNLAANLTQYCGRDYSDLEELLANLDNLLLSMVDAFSRIRTLISCPSVVPIYTEVVYKGACTSTPNALFWIFASCLTMGVTGMIMITLRSACKLTVYYAEGGEDGIGDDKPEEEVRTWGTSEEATYQQQYECEPQHQPPPQQRWIGWEEIEEEEDDDQQDDYYEDDDDDIDSDHSPSVISDPVYLHDGDDRAGRRRPPPPFYRRSESLPRGGSRWPQTAEAAAAFRRSAPQLVRYGSSSSRSRSRRQLYHRDCYDDY